jgi:hypothetical protein
VDLTESIAPKSDQLNADDLITGPRTYTVDRVTKGSTEQPFNIHLVENPGHPYRPSKSMRRVLVMAWGKESDEWPTGGRITLFRDPEVKFGRDEVGGIKISHLSHIDRPMTMALTVTRGKREPHTVDPLPADAPQGGTSAGGITPDHEAIIGAQMQRVGADSARMLELARQVTGRTVRKSRELTATEADALIVVLSELPDAPTGDDPTFPAEQ